MHPRVHVKAGARETDLVATPYFSTRMKSPLEAFTATLSLYSSRLMP